MWELLLLMQLLLALLTELLVVVQLLLLIQLMLKVLWEPSLLEPLALIRVGQPDGADTCRVIISTVI